MFNRKDMSFESRPGRSRRPSKILIFPKLQFYASPGGGFQNHEDTVPREGQVLLDLSKSPHFDKKTTWKTVAQYSLNKLKSSSWVKNFVPKIYNNSNSTVKSIHWKIFVQSNNEIHWSN